MPPAPPGVGFVGAGQMATALARGWAAAGLIDPAKCLASATRPATRAAFTAATGIPATADNAAVLAAAEVVVLAVKPAQFGPVCRGLRIAVWPQHKLISVAAGVSLARLREWLGESAKIVRVMPNTPSLVGAGAAGVAAGPDLPAADLDLVVKLFAAVGRAVVVPETQLDAVTGVSGCGPAFVFLLIEALADGGVRAGLPRAVALELAAQTVVGAGRMAQAAGTHPAALKDAVCSPGGATIAGVFALEQAGFRGAVMAAVAASAARSAELGRD